MSEANQTPKSLKAQITRTSLVLAASESEDVTEAYRNGRVQLDQAVGRILKHAGVKLPAHVVGIVVDGAAVAAISEGREVREIAAELLESLVSAYER